MSNISCGDVCVGGVCASETPNDTLVSSSNKQTADTPVS